MICGRSQGQALEKIALYWLPLMGHWEIETRRLISRVNVGCPRPAQTEATLVELPENAEVPKSWNRSPFELVV